MISHVLGLHTLIALTVALSAWFLSRYTIPRPPVGRFVRADIAVMVVALVAMPFAYLHVPVAIVVSVFGVVVFTFTQLTLAPVLGGRVAGFAALVLCGGDVAAYFAGWSGVVLVLNDVAVILLVVGAVNLWVQTAISPAQVAALAAALTLYDTLATGLTSLTLDFVARLDGLPFAPVLATRGAPEPSLVGLGDCLMLTLWPLVAYRSYGRIAGWTAAGVDAALLAVVVAAFLGGGGAVPLLTTLGPLIVVQWLYWRSRPVPVPSRPEVERALEFVPEAVPAGAAQGQERGRWVALADGGVVGEGPTPGSARRAARQSGAESVPVVTFLQPAE
ncbi:hypothetical protein GCM10009733_036920 [Nonomuraea maheshkhaliensis]|uniref:Uncharacterized protein n=1 Tax=Nonomuraea maheshkhaliensis TaxID=419590 RepID=A0ABP4R4Q5_9ACTN